MKKYAHKARGPHVAASMRLTPANHKFLHREAAKMGEAHRGFHGLRGF